MKHTCRWMAQGLIPLALLGGCATEPGSSTNGRSADVTKPTSANPGQVIESGATHVPPVLIHHMAPVYPFEMFKKGVEGVVVLRLVVTKEGTVGSVVIDSSTRMEFEMAALDAARQWKFTPAVVGGEPVACVIKIPLTFSLGKSGLP